MGLFRLLLAISVLIVHSTPIFGNNLVGGRIAVESFFMISGFYMGMILTTKYQTNLKLFYKNRFLKILPLYWFFTILVIVTSLITTGKFTLFKDYVISPLSKFVLIFFNLSPFFNDTTNFLGLNINSGNLFFTPDFRSSVPEIWNYLILPQGWTIGLEITFYLIAPFLVRQKIKILLLIASISLILRLISYYYLGLNHDPWEYRFFPFEILFFILGILAYRLYSLHNLRPTIYYLVPIFLFTIFFKYFPNIIFYYLIVFISIPILFKFTKDNRFDRFLGELSYPLYLCHFLVIDIFAQVLKVDHQFLGLYSLLVSLPLALVSYLLIQKPLEKLR